MHTVWNPLIGQWQEPAAGENPHRVVEDQGQTALMFAAKGGHKDVAIALLGADTADERPQVDATDAQGDTALIHAARRGEAPVIAVLCEKMNVTSVNALNNRRESALLLAVIAAKAEAMCPNGHSLRRGSTRHWTCDGCQTGHAGDAVVHSCRPCDFDLCDQCFARASDQQAGRWPPFSLWTASMSTQRTGTASARY